MVYSHDMVLGFGILILMYILTCEIIGDEAFQKVVSNDSHLTKEYHIVTVKANNANIPLECCDRLYDSFVQFHLRFVYGLYSYYWLQFYIQSIGDISFMANNHDFKIKAFYTLTLR
ncbi:hypothetical protein SLEP1_g12302 [Rubroshorea leprosula]|uniref:Uncharacterized protein n=1 Tax=Rubroshorea leprosula TaxID=152421 RepID=A0AAV5IC30_9ROSI|nr:hypothetical protein SLEP1_g12302 [Rubroshorea leprosula]